MKINAKIAALAGAALLMGSAAFAVNSYDGATDDYELPQGFSFSNEIGSDGVDAKGSFYNKKTKDEAYQVEFAGIYDKVSVSYTSEKFWFELAPKFAISEGNELWNDTKTATFRATNRATNNDDLGFNWAGLDWGVRFTPFDIVDFVLNTDTWTPGGYLPIVDQHVGGNLTGDGVGVVFKPIDGLRLGLEIPFGYDFISKPNYMNAEYEDELRGTYAGTTVAGGTTPGDYRFKFNVGADYKLLDMITVGAFITDVINRDRRGYGIYANAGISFLDFNLGYTYNGDATKVSFLDFTANGPDDVKVVVGGHHKANLAVKAAFGDFSAQLEALMNFFKTQSFYDLYAGLKVGYDLLPGKFNIFLGAGVAYDMGNRTTGGVGYINYKEQGAGKETLTVANKTKKGSGDRTGTKAKCEVLAPMVEIQPGLVYKTGANEFGAKLNLQYWLDGEGSYAANTPVYWKYTF